MSTVGKEVIINMEKGLAYNIISEICQGPNAIVYKAVRIDENGQMANSNGNTVEKPAQATVAIKVAHAVNNEERLLPLYREASMQSQIQHPNIVPVEWYQLLPQKMYIIMEYMEYNVEDWINALLNSKIGISQLETEILKLLQVVKKLLTFLQSKDLCHGNLKPQNILLHSDWRIKLTGFRGKNPVMKTDTFTLGKIFLNLLTKTPPASAEAVIHDNLRKISKLPRLHKILKSMLQQQPTMRYAGNPEIRTKTQWGKVFPGSNNKRYIVEKTMDIGNTTVTYIARNEADDVPVVIKSLAPQVMDNDEFNMRFFQEAKTVLNFRHENLIRGYDLYFDYKFAHFIMEFIEGNSIAELVKLQNMEQLFATKIIFGVSAALVHLESKNLLHRDIKPANIVVNKHQIPKLIDFGIVKSMQTKLAFTAEEDVVGTPQYMSPEQLSGQPVDMRSDIFSLGLTFYRMVIGKDAFPSKKLKDVDKRLHAKYYPDPLQVKPDLHPYLVDVLKKMMERKPKNRFQSAQELYTQLNKLVAVLEQH